MIKQRNYIIFSSIDWSAHWQIHHQLVNSIIESGSSVLFIENTGVRTPKIKDFGRIMDRIKIRLNSTYGFRSVDKNLTVFAPIFIPYPYNKLSIFLNALIISGSINKWIKAAEFYDPICISFLPTPTVQKVLIDINSSMKIYYCADEMSRSITNPSILKKYENRLFKNADLVFTTSHKLYKKAIQFSSSVHDIPAGIDSKKFPPKVTPTIPSDIKHIPFPIIGYIGAIGDMFDKGLIVKLAKSLPSVNIVLVGPRYTSISALENIKNIFIIGERSHDLMPNYINGFDVALIPYAVNEATNSVYSCKLNEYLSLGKIVLSTNLQEIKLFNKKNNNLINVAKSTEDFIQKTEKIVENLIEDTEENRIERINTAKKNTWDKRFLKIESAIGSCVDSKSNYSKNWKEALINKHKKSNYLLFGKISIVFYLLIFQSPLFWLLGDQLVVKDLLQKSDAIVVFSGDGKFSYRNLSYQNRALDAINIYKKGYANKIFLSSGREQSIADVEIIKLYLINKGVPKSSVFLLEEYPDSTYKNVKLVSRDLKKNNVKSIVFLTAPYHTKRAELLWRKNNPGIKISTPDTRKDVYKEIRWGVELKEMQVIMREYAAILHNWFFDRI
mgnify:FL=1